MHVLIDGTGEAEERDFALKRARRKRAAQHVRKGIIRKRARRAVIIDEQLALCVRRNRQRAELNRRHAPAALFAQRVNHRRDAQLQAGAGDFQIQRWIIRPFKLNQQGGLAHVAVGVRDDREMAETPRRRRKKGQVGFHAERMRDAQRPRRVSRRKFDGLVFHPLEEFAVGGAFFRREVRGVRLIQEVIDAQDHISGAFYRFRQLTVIVVGRPRFLEHIRRNVGRGAFGAAALERVNRLQRGVFVRLGQRDIEPNHRRAFLAEFRHHLRDPAAPGGLPASKLVFGLFVHRHDDDVAARRAGASELKAQIKGFRLDDFKQAG